VTKSEKQLINLKDKPIAAVFFLQTANGLFELNKEPVMPYKQTINDFISPASGEAG
jgi:hypothetical protein